MFTMKPERDDDALYYIFNVGKKRREKMKIFISSFSCSDSIQRKKHRLLERKCNTNPEVEFELFIFPHPQAPSEHLTERTALVTNI